MMNLMGKGLSLLRGVSLGIILFALFFKVIYAWVLLFPNIVNQQLMTNAVRELIEISMYVHIKLLNTAFFLVVALLMRKKINTVMFASVLFVSFALDYEDWIEHYIHHQLQELNVYAFLQSEEEKFVNSQYTRVFLFLLAIVPLAIMVMFKKTRSLDRIFVLLIGGSVLVTTFLFHAAIPASIYKYIRAERKESFFVQLEDLKLYGKCSSNCLVSSASNEIKIKGDVSLFEKNKDFIEGSRTSKTTKFAESGDFVGKHLMMKACGNYKDKLYCVIDTNVIKNHGYLSIFWTSFLCGIAHATWIFGGMALLWRHKNRGRKVKDKNK